MVSLLHHSTLAWSAASTEYSLPDVVGVRKQKTCDERVTVSFRCSRS